MAQSQNVHMNQTVRPQWDWRVPMLCNLQSSGFTAGHSRVVDVRPKEFEPLLLHSAMLPMHGDVEYLPVVRFYSAL